MSREILILRAGRHQRPAWEKLCADYRRRMERDFKIRDQLIKVKVGGEGKARLRAEAQALLAALPDPCWTIVLDPRGRTRTSEKFAAELHRLREEWPHPIAFVLGSDLGLEQQVVEQARQRLSFGPMVFGHELARLVLYEQLYRASTIGRGINYHRPSL